MTIETVGLCVECYAAYQYELQQNGVSSIVTRYNTEADITQHLIDNPTHQISAAFIWKELSE